jgi:hypothetical protein
MTVFCVYEVALWGRMVSGAASGTRRAGRMPLGPQVANLPHKLRSLE